jgi:hypothetical protein
MNYKACLLLVILVLSACKPVTGAISTEDIESAPTLVLAQVQKTPTSRSPSNVHPTPTPKLERWVEYQNALSSVFLPLTPGLCEWDILGQAGKEVYVWAICQVADSDKGTAMSAPAVIYLAEDKSIEKVEVPRDGSLYSIDIRQMFPQELQGKILSQSIDNLQEMWAHIQSRHNAPEPPLIVTSGVSLP